MAASMKRASRIVLLLALIACGARTSLRGGDVQEAEDSSVTDAREEEDAIDAPFDAAEEPEVDSSPPLDTRQCAIDSDCDDGVACTTDKCDATGRCVSAPSDAFCRNLSYCDGVERCDPILDCVSGTPPCADAVSCTRDTCIESTDSCEYIPDDTLCPLSYGCDPDLGCQARALAHDNRNLYEIRLPSGQLRTIGPTGVILTDVALLPSNKLYGIRTGSFYDVNQSTGAATLIGTSGIQFWTALDADPTGELYGAAGNLVYRLTTSGIATEVAKLPAGFSSSGDIAFLNGRMLATVRLGSNVVDALAEVNLTTGTSTLLGNVNFRCVYGLAAFGSTLYGLTCEGRVLSIDGAKGTGTEINRIAGIQFGGASAR